MVASRSAEGSDAAVMVTKLLCDELPDRFTKAECRNCFKHCGYRYT